MFANQKIQKWGKGKREKGKGEKVKREKEKGKLEIRKVEYFSWGTLSTLSKKVDKWNIFGYSEYSEWNHIYTFGYSKYFE